MIKDRKGFLSPMAMIFIVIMVIVGMGILYLGALEKLDAKRRLNREKAFYLAEAGAYRAYAHLKEDREWEPEEEPLSLGGGTFDVSREDGDDYIDIISIGNVKGLKEKVKLTFYYKSIWSNGFYGKEALQLTGHSAILGYDSRDGSSSNDYQVGSGSIVSTGGSSSISGDIKEYSSLPFPDIEIAPPALLNMNYTQEGDTGLSGYYTINNHNFSVQGITEMFSGNYKFNDFGLHSTLTIKGNVNLYIEGLFSMSSTNANIILAQNAKLKMYFAYPNGAIDITGGSINRNGYSANVEIYSLSEQSFTIGGNTQICAVLYAPYIDFIASQGTPVFKGSVVSNKITATGTVNLYYDIALKDNIDLGPQIPALKRWTKPGWANRLQ